MEPDNPLPGDLAGIDSRVRRAAERLRRGAGDPCERAFDVLAALDSGGAALRDPAPAVREHLRSCGSCSELVAAFAAAVADEAAAASERVPPGVARAVGAVLAAVESSSGSRSAAASSSRLVSPRRSDPRSRAGFFRRFGGLVAAVAAAAAILVAVVEVVPRAHPLSAEVTMRRIPPATGASGMPSGAERDWGLVVEASLDRPGYVYAVVSFTLGARWETLWLEPCRAPEGRRAGAHAVAGRLPEGAMDARCALVALPRPLGVEQRESIERAASPARGASGARALADLGSWAARSGGVLVLEPVPQETGLPPSPDRAGEIEALFAGGAPEEALLSALVRREPDAARIVAARFCDAAIASGDDAPFAAAESLALALAAADPSGDDALVRRVAAVRAIAADPARLASRRELDAFVRRASPPHDDDFEALLAAMRVDLDRAAAAFDAAAERYDAIGDEWGSIECAYRAGLAIRDPEAAAARFERLAARAREAAYPRGEALALFGSAVATWRRASTTTLERIRDTSDAAAVALIASGLDVIAGAAQSNLGFFYMQQGALGDAFERLRQAFLLHERSGAAFEQAINLGKLSWAHELLGRYEDALELALDAAERLRAVAADPFLGASKAPARAEAKSLWRASCAAIGLGDLEAAAALARQAHDVAVSIGDGDTAARARTAKANVALEEGRIEEALIESEAAVAAFDPRANPWHRALALSTRGRALEAEGGRDDEAAAAYAAAHALFERQDIRDRIAAAETLARAARLEERRGDLEAALATRLRGLLSAEAVIDERGLRPADRASLRSRFRPLFEAGVALACRLGSAEGALRFMEGARPAALHHLARVPGSIEPRALEIALGGVAALLDEGTAWVEYLAGGETSFALVVGDGGEAAIRDLGFPKAELAARIGALASALRSEERDAARSIAFAGRAAGEALLDPIADLVASRSRLRLVLDDALAALAPAALVDGKGRFLAATHALSVEPSARVALERALAPGDAGPRGGLLVWAGPGRAGAARAFAEAEVVSGAAATADRFTSGSLSEFAAIHVAARACEPSILETADGAGLGPADVAAMPRLRAATVVLDVIDVEPGIRGGRTGAEFSRAFLRAGARSVLAPAERVPRRAAAALLAAFHEEAARGPGGAADALRRAQLSLLSGEDAALADPRAWAPWVVVGE